MIELNSSEYNSCQHPTASLSAVPSISEPLDYDHFFREYLEKNVPCVFSERFTAAWRARRCWVTRGGTPDLQHLLHHFGTLPPGIISYMSP